MATKRPLINSAPVSEFGAAMPQDGGNDASDIDLLYVPGFSDLRKQRDLELGEVAEGRRTGREVSSLPVNCMWVSVVRGDSKPSSTKLMRFANDGYKPVTKDMVGTVAWLTAIPPGAREMPDGTIVNAAGDLQLHYVDAGRAAVNKARMARAALQQIDSVGGDLGDGAEGLNSVVEQTSWAKDPTVERTAHPIS